MRGGRGTMCRDPEGGENMGGKAHVAGTQGSTRKEGKGRRLGRGRA